MSELTPAQLQEALDKSPSGVRVTKDMIESRIAKTEYIRLPGTTVTICNLTLDNGFSVRGEASCVDPKNYNQDIGQTVARDNAVQALWPLFGFLIAEMQYVAGVQRQESDFLHAAGVKDGQ